MITYENECPFCLNLWDKSNEQRFICAVCNACRHPSGLIELKVGNAVVMWQFEEGHHNSCCVGTQDDHDNEACRTIIPPLPFDINAIRIAITFS